MRDLDQPSQLSSRDRATGAAAAALLIAVVVASTFAISWQSGQHPSTLTRDPIAVLDGSWHAGFVSSLGIACWIAGGVAALLAWSVLRRRRDRGGDTGFLLHGGLLTLGLALDDLLLVHERWVPELLPVSERLFEFAWIAATLAVVIVHRRVLFARRHVALAGSALLMLGASALLDLYLPRDIGFDDRQLIEDLPKFAGIVLWATFLVLLSRTCLLADERGRLRPPMANLEPAAAVPPAVRTLLADAGLPTAAARDTRDR